VLTGVRIAIRDEQSGDVRARAFSRLPVRIGRNPLNDLQLDEPFISQFHAVLEVDEQGHLALRDLGSRNGTMIGGQRVPSNERLGLGSSEASFSVLGLTFEARLAAVTNDGAPGSPRAGGKQPKFLAATMMGDAMAVAAMAGLPPSAGKIEEQARETRASLDRLQELLAAELPRMQQGARDMVVAKVRTTCSEALESPKMKGVLGSLGMFDLGAGRSVVDALRAFAAGYSRPEAAPVTDDDLRRFIDKLQVVLGVFLKTFIPLRDGHRQFESGLNLGRNTGRTRAFDGQAASVSSARDATTLAHALFDPRDEADTASRQVEETFADLMIHEVALLGGVMRGVTALLKELSPAEIERALDGKTHKIDVGASWGWFRWRALYRIFATRHADYADEEKKTYSKIFGAEFAEAYDRYVDNDKS
jgi:type VI secretion system protein ImpI